MTHHSLIDAYKRTNFTVCTDESEFTIRIGEKSTDLDALLKHHGAEEWAYITAYNPRSQTLPDVENKLRQVALEKKVSALGGPFYHGLGVADDGQWPPEKSILIVGIGRKMAVQLGREFGQAAVVFGKKQHVAELIMIDERS